MTTTLFAFLVSALAPLCVYLASDEQRITRAPLHWLWRVIGMVLAVAGVALWTPALSYGEALFGSVAMWTTAYVVLPYISWVKQPLGQPQ